MSFSIGIVGLPNIGKSTLFRALTKKEVKVDARPFSTINPNIGKILVPDKRLEEIARIVKPEKTTPTTIEFIDIAGLVKNAYQGAGLGNRFLSSIRECDALVEILRGFHDPKIEHIEKNIDPLRDAGIIKTEFLMKDLQTLENSILKIKGDKKENQKKLNVLEKLKEEVQKGVMVSEIELQDEEKETIKEYRLLTQKPKLFVLNINREDPVLTNRLKKELGKIIMFNLKLEQEISELTKSDLKELKMRSCLDQLILNCYDILNLITFYTIAKGKETRAWTLKKGGTAQEAGGRVHSDFEEKFIRADILNWEKLIEAGSWNDGQRLGFVKTAGKEHVVQDGDVIEFKI